MNLFSTTEVQVSMGSVERDYGSTFFITQTKDIVVHPKYSEFSNDIALLRTPQICPSGKIFFVS